MREEKLKEFIESILDYCLSERGDRITGMVEVAGVMKPFELHGSIARDVHRLRVAWEDN